MDTAENTPQKSPYQIALGVNIWFTLVSMGLCFVLLTAMILGLDVVAILFAVPMTISLVLTIVWDKKARQLRDSY